MKCNRIRMATDVHRFGYMTKSEVVKAIQNKTLSNENVYFFSTFCVCGKHKFEYDVKTGLNNQKLYKLK